MPLQRSLAADAVLHTYPSELAQTFWTAIAGFTTCAVVTALLSLVTRRRPVEELRGLVYSLTPHEAYEDRSVPWHKRPAALAAVVLAATLALNVIFW